MAELLAFVPRLQEAPVYRRPEVRLSEDGRAVELTVFDDEAGNVEIVEFVVASSSPNFDFNRLCRSWAMWRGSPACVS